ncbi:ORMDL-domain-containing protein [Peniophora sp. CONT]|nr:ORMDL-domain-containing protein [Peniophora sp. CONT]
MVHYMTGIPLGNELTAGAYDDVTMWEQLDGGAQYTPAKKWLFTVPVGLFLLSTHYTNYDPIFLMITHALVFVLVPKLLAAYHHRLRFPAADDPRRPSTRP